MRRSPRFAALLAIAALSVAAACGGDDEGLSDEEQAYADAFAADMTNDAEGMNVSDEEAECMSEAVMQELGVEPFEEADVQPADLEGDEAPGELLGEGAVSDEQAETIADTWLDCADLPKSLAANLGESADLDEDAQACVEEGLGDGDVIKGYLMASFTSGEPDQDDPAFADLLSLVTDCGKDEDGNGGPIVDGIAQSLAAGGTLDEEQSQCMAQAIVDEVGADQILEAGNGPSPELEAQMNQAVLSAAADCGVSPEQMGG